MSMIKGFLLCYRTGKEANKIFDDLVALRKKTNIQYDLFQLLNETDVPYPHVIIISVSCIDFDALDKTLCEFDFGNVDTYALEGRIHEIKQMTFIRKDLSDLFKKYLKENPI